MTTPELNPELTDKDLNNAFFNLLSSEDKTNVSKFYNTFTTIPKPATTIPTPSITLSEQERLIWLSTMVRSGLAMKDLKRDEVRLLSKAYGKKWYTKLLG
jgi:hypothetical protein